MSKPMPLEPPVTTTIFIYLVLFQITFDTPLSSVPALFQR
jgi:hypothetical protein